MLARHIVVSPEHFQCMACACKKPVPASEYAYILTLFNEEHKDCITSDRVKIELSTEPYIWIGGKDGVFNYKTAIHFRLQKQRSAIWCTHGNWWADLVYDDSGNLTNFRITGWYPSKDSMENSAPDYPGRLKWVDGYQLTMFPGGDMKMANTDE